MTDPAIPGSPWGPTQPGPASPTQPTPAGPTQPTTGGPLLPPPAWSGQPPPGWSGQPPPAYPPTETPGPNRGKWIRLAVILAIAVVIGGGFVLIRDRLSNDVASLQPGDCFDQPAAGQTTVTDVQRQPCNELHDAEVFANVTHTAASGAAYPLRTEFEDLAGDECVPKLLSYTGRTIDQLLADGFNFGYFYPTSEGWGDGDRTVTCYAYNRDDSKSTGTLRTTGGASPSP